MRRPCPQRAYSVATLRATKGALGEKGEETVKNGRGKDERTKAGGRGEKTAEEAAEEMRALAQEMGLDVKIRAHPRAKELAGQTVLYFGGRRGGAAEGSDAVDKGKDY